MGNLILIVPLRNAQWSSGMILATITAVHGHDSMISEEEKGSGYRGITAEGAGMIDRDGETERVTNKYHYSYPHQSRFLSLPSDTFLR